MYLKNVFNTLQLICKNKIIKKFRLISNNYNYEINVESIKKNNQSFNRKNTTTLKTLSAGAEVAGTVKTYLAYASNIGQLDLLVKNQKLLVLLS